MDITFSLTDPAKLELYNKLISGQMAGEMVGQALTFKMEEEVGVPLVREQPNTVGIVVGTVVGALFIAALAVSMFVIKRRRINNKTLSSSDGSNESSKVIFDIEKALKQTDIDEQVKEQEENDIAMDVSKYLPSSARRAHDLNKTDDGNQSSLLEKYQTAEESDDDEDVMIPLPRHFPTLEQVSTSSHKY